MSKRRLNDNDNLKQETPKVKSKMFMSRKYPRIIISKRAKRMSYNQCSATTK